MQFLFVYAHPDDETVAAGGMVRLMTDQGHTCNLVMVTDGGAGEVDERAAEKLGMIGTKETLRTLELRTAGEILGYRKLVQLHYQDGMLSNTDTWGRLTDHLVGQIESFQPDVVVTFDHTGWYYHLDHIAVSVATTRAVQRVNCEVKAIAYNWFRPMGIEEKWPYAYVPMQHNYKVFIAAQKMVKIAAIRAHASQKLDHLVELVRAGKLDEEYFELTFFDKTVRRQLEKSGFSAV
jgi:N-acetylglucosamine malate deacetylase 2